MTGPARSPSTKMAMGASLPLALAAAARQRRRAPIAAAAAVGAALIASVCIARRPPSACADAVPLLGGRANWKPDSWRLVSDSVRGGSSISTFKGVGKLGMELKGTVKSAAVTDGHGFAGAQIEAKALPRGLSTLKGLRISVAEGDGREYGLVLSMRGAIAGATHRFAFKGAGPQEVDLPFEEFTPMMRGRPAPEPAPYLDLARVDQLTLQIDSLDAAQEGPFSMVVNDLSGVPGFVDLKPVEEDPDAWRCSACGTKNGGTTAICVRCGARQGARPVDELKAEREARLRQKWVCRCGARNFASLSECYKCGLPRE